MPTERDPGERRLADLDEGGESPCFAHLLEGDDPATCDGEPGPPPVETTD